MKNMKLKVRLFGGFGAILLAIAICSGYALIGMNQVKRDATVVVSDNLPGIYNVGRLQFLTATNLSTVKEAVAATDPVKVAVFSELIRTRSVDVKATLKAYEDSIFVDEDRALFRKVTEALEPWVRARDGSMALAGAGKAVEARRVLEDQGEPAFVAYQATLKALADFNKTHADEGARAITATLSSVSSTMEVGMVMAVLIGLVIATLISRSVSQPVGQVLHHVERVGRGDLESRCAYDSRDEIGALAAETNKMAEDLKRARDAERLKAEEDNRRQAELQGKVDQLLRAVKDIGRGDLTTDIPVRGTDAVGQLGEGLTQLVDDLNRNMSAIARNAQTLASSSEQLTAASQQMSANCEETSAQAGTVSSASEQLSKNVQTVAAASEEMSVSIKEIASSAQRATTVATSAVRAVEKTSATIAKLGTSSAEIGEVINLITSIAAQTNLLALNATIEAARAGDAGKGFAVVASEVKELAKATAKATEDIGHRIGAIQADSTEAVRAIGEIRQVIDQVNELSLTIASAVEEQTSTTNEIGRNVAEAAKGTDEIARNITGVAQAAQSTAAGSTETQASAESLGKMAADLQGLVSRFKLDDAAPVARSARLSSVPNQTTAWTTPSAA